ncbi:dead deah box dna helicase [Ophiostoma piceae UAMH 11346]|uniref:Dead deah box dna helicase n=1 Tax=Ophiostoma piceae (strain UAMH 11346) TaxID=1262450 RepID=S3C9V5_OPHP1|nr:dead deah box dna helicase [Ophiostoma piceae UAMH 11346]
MENLRTANRVTPLSKASLISLETAVLRAPSSSVDTMRPAATTPSTTVEAGPAPDVLFTSARDVLARIETLEGDALVVGDVSASDFRVLERQRDVSGRKYRLFYLSDVSCLIITVPTFKHETIHRMLWFEILLQVVQMGLEGDWAETGGTTYPGPAGSSGEWDSGGFPWSQRRRGDWPTLVVESGYTQTMPSLYAKMRWCFSTSDHQVKVVILAKIVRSEVRIHIEMWQEVVLRPGATATRWATGAGLGAPQPRCMQTVDVCWAGLVPFPQASQAARMDPGSFSVAGGPLTIDFALVFLRAPAMVEHDLVVADDDLKVLAVRLWS